MEQEFPNALDQGFVVAVVFDLCQFVDGLEFTVAVYQRECSECAVGFGAEALHRVAPCHTCIGGNDNSVRVEYPAKCTVYIALEWLERAYLGLDGLVWLTFHVLARLLSFLYLPWDGDNSSFRAASPSLF